MRTPTPTHLNTFVRDASSWPAHRKRNQARRRTRKVVTRRAQEERDKKMLMNPAR